MQQSSKPYIIGLDIGTSSAKAVAFTLQGRSIDQFSAGYALHRPEPDAAVQDADAVLQATLKALRRLIRELGTPPAAIGLSSAMHSLMAVNQHGRPISDLITWADGRARTFAEGLRGTEAGQYLYQHSGTPIHAMSPLCKLLWLRDQQPKLFEEAALFVGIKEYLLHHCFGEWRIDHSLASATGFFDLKKRQWIPEALDLAGITASRLPKPVPSSYVFPEMRAEPAKFLGLPPATPWVIGASDGCLANLGAGMTDSQEAVLTIGTSGAIRMTVPGAVYDPQERLFCYILDEKDYVIGGASNNGGVVWEWFSKQFYPDRTMDQVFDEVKQIPPGAEGLLFLPYLYGERAPIWDASAKGYFGDIEARHNRAHFARAVLEGICLNLYQITEALEMVGGTIKRFRANGGFVQSPIWVQLLADVMGKEIIISANQHASAWGAAMMAMQATGHQLPSPKQEQSKVYLPNRDNHLKYLEIFPRFKRMYKFHTSG